MNHAVSESSITVMGVKLRTYVLDDGQRVINADDADALFKVMCEGFNPTKGDEDGD